MLITQVLREASVWRLRNVRPMVLLAAIVLVAIPAAFAQSEPLYGGVLRVGTDVVTRSFDPHQAPNQSESWIQGLVYSQLVDLDSALTPIPDLALSWEMPDPLTYVFTLRENARFHNGDPITSADVKYSFERLLDPNTGSSKRQLYSNIVAIETPSPYTVRFNLDAPNSALITHLAAPAASIVSRTVVEEYGDLSQHDGGSGPFVLDGLKADNTLVISRFDDYFVDGLPYLDRVDFVPYIDNQARNAAIRTGDIDFVTRITGSFIQLLKQDGRLEFADGPGYAGQYYALFLNNDSPPFNDANVRRAIAAALDRQLITRVALGGEGEALEAGPIPPWHWAAMDPYFVQPDMEAAKRYLEQSSAPTGFSFKLRVWASQDYAVNAALVIQQTLEPLGITVEIDQQGDWVTYWGAVSEGTYEATIQGFGGNTDPDQFLGDGFSSKGGLNVTHYRNAAFDELLQGGKSVLDHSDRYPYYERAQQLLVDEVPAVFLFNMYQTEAFQPYVKGYVHLSTLDLTSFAATWIAPH